MKRPAPPEITPLPGGFYFEFNLDAAVRRLDATKLPWDTALAWVCLDLHIDDSFLKNSKNEDFERCKQHVRDAVAAQREVIKRETRLARKEFSQAKSIYRAHQLYADLGVSESFLTVPQCEAEHYALVDGWQYAEDRAWVLSHFRSPPEEKPNEWKPSFSIPLFVTRTWARRYE